MKIEDVLGEDRFEFRRGKGTTDSIGMPKIIPEGTSQIDEEFRACFIDWQEAFDHVKWTELMQIVMKTGIDWSERRLFMKF